MLMWLSFAKKSGSLGGLIGEGDTFEDIVLETWLRGVNPGGEIYGVEVPQDGYDNAPVRLEKWRLYTRKEMEQLGMNPVSVSDLIDEADESPGS